MKLINWIKLRARINAAKIAGNKDGKAGIPLPEWAPDSVPYLTEVYGTSRMQISNVQQVLLNIKQRRKQKQHKKSTELESAKKLHQELKQYEIEKKTTYDLAKEEFDGDNKEAPASKFARLRTISIFWYAPLLITMVIGEFAITFPAFEKFLNDITLRIGIPVIDNLGIQTSFLTTLGASALTVAFAHVLGVVTKLGVDREKPLPSWVMRVSFVIGSLVFVTILLISVLRGASAKSDALESTIASEDLRRLFVFLLFLVLQAALVSVAAALSFLHHSIHIDDLRKAKRIWNKARKAEHKLNRQITKLTSATSLDLEQLETNLNEQFKVKIAKINGEYEKVCGAYITANLRTRSTKLDGSVDPFKLRSLI